MKLHLIAALVISAFPLVSLAQSEPAPLSPLLQQLPSGPPAPLAPQDVPADVLPVSTMPTDRPMPVVPAFEPMDGAVAMHTSPPPPVNLYSDTDSTLSTRERESVGISKRWIDGARDRPAPGRDGAVVFRLGAGMPAVVCAPLYVCDIALAPGERVNAVQVGDPVRWKITPATSGSGAAEVVHVTVKPSDIGLTTNLSIYTDRRAYAVKLVSRKDDWMPAVTFSYPEDEAAQWALLAQQQRAQRTADVLPATGQSVASLDFGFNLSGDKPKWRPLRVYSDGAKTFIQFPEAVSSSEMPALLALGDDDKEQLVNYRVVGDRFVVDKVLEEAILVSGVGRRQVKVSIEREEGR